jgi:hypothetical protein
MQKMVLFSVFELFFGFWLFQTPLCKMPIETEQGKKANRFDILSSENCHFESVTSKLEKRGNLDAIVT